MLRKRRQDEGENPAWPGLVDVFAFTLVFVLLLGLGDDPGNKIEKLSKEKSKLQEENEKLKKAVTNLNELIGGRGLKELKEFYNIVKNKLPQNYSIDLDEDAIEIVITGEPPIYFNTNEYKLSFSDSHRLSILAPIIFILLQEKPFYIIINGTADPRFLPDRGIPPHNNVELSALRAATVADLLEKAAPGVVKYLRVAGLGVRGEEAPLELTRKNTTKNSAPWTWSLRLM